MAMDALSAAIQMVNAVRLFVAAYQGEAKVILASRQLLRSCELYHESLLSLRMVLNGKSGSGSDRRLQTIVDQIQDDVLLLKEINDETQSVALTTSKYGTLRNTVTTLVTGRQEKLKELEKELMNRVQTITMVLVTLQTTSGSAEIMNIVQDTDGAMLWSTNFGSERVVSFQRFLNAYQAYLTQTFLFRRLPAEQLQTLLRCSLLEDNAASLSPAATLQAEVSIDAFAKWLRLFGPLKDTPTKASAVSIPSLDRPVTWFQRSTDRALASKRIENAAKSGSSSAERVVIVRYSSDPKYHLVVSTLPPGLEQVQHLPIQNTAMGYIVTGESCAYAPTLLECIQLNILDKLFNTSGAADRAELSRQSLEEWERLYESVVQVLPENHYKDLDEVSAATTALQMGVTANTTSASGASFAKFLGVDGVSTADIGVTAPGEAPTSKATDAGAGFDDHKGCCVCS